MSTELLVQEPVFNPGEFAEPEELTDAIWEKLSVASHYFFRLRCEQEAPAILAPLVALAERSGISSCRTKKSIAVILRWMVRRRKLSGTGIRRRGRNFFPPSLILAPT